MNTRLLRFLEAENISQSQFADSIGVARASISHILSGRNKPGFDFLEKLASQYPNLSL
ncbi:MAG: helix-turn-helix transcriptional regulator, partial [Bacteroidales bacterium]|nr:helix-turn-helix transcriptional regulator [Bacteroidales bacterium]